MMYIDQCRNVAEMVNAYSEAKLNLRLRELGEIQSREDFLTFEEQLELTYICLKVLTLKNDDH